MPGPPPPPPGPPPPVAVSSSGPSKPASNALLSQIQKGARLKKTETVDKSAPLVEATPKNNSAGVSSSNGGASKGPVMPRPGGLFAGGMPKLKSSGGGPSKFGGQHSLPAPNASSVGPVMPNRNVAPPPTTSLDKPRKPGPSTAASMPPQMPTIAKPQNNPPPVAARARAPSIPPPIASRPRAPSVPSVVVAPSLPSRNSPGSVRRLPPPVNSNNAPLSGRAAPPPPPSRSNATTTMPISRSAESIVERAAAMNMNNQPPSPASIHRQQSVSGAGIPSSSSKQSLGGSGTISGQAMEQDGRWNFHPTSDLPVPRYLPSITKVYVSGNKTGSSLPPLLDGNQSLSSLSSVSTRSSPGQQRRAQPPPPPGRSTAPGGSSSGRPAPPPPPRR